MLNPSSFISASASAPPPTRPAAADASASPDPVADTIVTVSDGDTVDELTVDMPAEIGDADAAPEIKGLWAAIRSDGFAQALSDRLAPYMEPGSASRTMLDRFGIFNVNQVAVQIPLGVPGVSGKYGIQINIVKPDIASFGGTYYLQLFPIHDEIGFNLPEALESLFPSSLWPAWLGLSAQIIRNHGFNIPFIHTDTGWKCGGPDNRAEYLEEWVIRPLEPDWKHFGPALQGTIALELGVHFKWASNNRMVLPAAASNALANVVGAKIGLMAGTLSGPPASPAKAMLMMHGGAMLGQLTMHGLQCLSNALCPDEIVTWAGATFSACDLNMALFSPRPDTNYLLTEYPRIWAKVHDGVWHLKEQAEAAVAPIIRRAENIRATEMAEMGIDNSLFPRDTPLSTVRERIAAPISERYAAQQF